MNDTFLHKGQRRKLVEEIKRKGINDQRVLDAINNVPRHAFLESGLHKFAYKDQAFPIGNGQTISQPFTVAFQTELLDVEKNHKVLEVGTGSGYQAAVLLEMGVKVYSIERQRELYVRAQAVLTELGYLPHLFYGDGYAGKPTYGPFDRIIITAGANDVPETLLKQLKIGGKMVIPVGDRERQTMSLVEKLSENEYEKTSHGSFVFVPLLKGTT